MPDYLYLDIETIPTTSPDIIAEIAANVTPPKNLKKAESIAAWERDQKPCAVKDAVERLGLDGATGHICCIGWAWNDGDVTCNVLQNTRQEDDLISLAFENIADLRPSHEMPTIVGHYVGEFDIRFIWQRAFVTGAQLPLWFPRDPKPWSKEVNDTMHMWAGSKGTISLDRLCKTLGIEGKTGTTGADVAGMWGRGENGKIAEYCRDDVKRVRAVHQRMLASMGVE